MVSTKTWTCTAVAFALLALQLGPRARPLGGERRAAARGARRAARADREIMAREAELAAIAQRLAAAEHAYFVGRAAGYAVAMEGALKLKEISYLHAEAYPASELKHGPLALIAPRDADRRSCCRTTTCFAKNLSTIAEVRARRGPVLAITHPGDVPAAVDGEFAVPRSEPELDPILLNMPLQLLAYQVALRPRPRHRPAAQPGEVGDGGVAAGNFARRFFGRMIVLRQRLNLIGRGHPLTPTLSPLGRGGRPRRGEIPSPLWGEG